MYSTIIKESFNAFKVGDENFYNNLKMFRELFPNINYTSMSDSKLFEERIKALSDTELENLQRSGHNILRRKPTLSHILYL